jgi:hypothetical protein
MNEADGGFKRPSDEGTGGGGRERKRTYAQKRDGVLDNFY